MSNGNPNGLLALAALGGLGRNLDVQGVWYNAKEVKLDGYRFVSCRFDRCVLIVTSNNFELENCFVSADTAIHFGSDVAKPIRMFNIRNEKCYKESPFFAPAKNPDGTITVKA